MALAVLATNDLENCLRSTSRNLTVFGDYPLFDLFVRMREQSSGAEIHEIGLQISEYGIVQVVHEV